MNFSANLGFLWRDRPLEDAIRAAHRAGFAAVECHWPYDNPAQRIRDVLAETSLPMLGLNTRPGEPGEFGTAALPGREAEARDAIDEAIAYADAIDADAIHVMAGAATGPEAEEQFLGNLLYAVDRTKRTLLIEPLNRHDAPGYFLKTTDQARDVIEHLGAPHLKLMFDCYHVGRAEGDVATRLADLLPLIGHIQFASVPDRGPPDTGELTYAWLFRRMTDLGWTRPLGAEYKPGADTDASLGWLERLGV